MVDYKEKYLKYKAKYLDLKAQLNIDGSGAKGKLAKPSKVSEVSGMLPCRVTDCKCKNYVDDDDDECVVCKHSFNMHILIKK